ncbi:MAG: isochorismatase family protein, partial [Planctomycetaceae bacterium]|nr:isochorismatase family protein [Planctomycetaceae bacterium]
MLPSLVLGQSDSPMLDLSLRSQSETSPGSGRFHLMHRDEQWNPKETALIVCDVWDLHHCLKAVRRLEEFAPRLNEVVKAAREQGVTIIHSPSDCMAAYADHPARSRAEQAPGAEYQPPMIDQWCSRIPSEERGVYPIDQSDGGEDDNPVEHQEWAAKLKAMGRNPGTPWKKQHDKIEIDTSQDYITDKGVEVWNILSERGIKNVILTGVHVNMCVLGRPFGLRQMARNGKNVVLMRDMTDAMYNPERWPYVSHYTGNDLIISHIERFICPTITSDQLLGGEPFQFSKDTRPHLVMVIAEDPYHTQESLPQFAANHLGKQFRVTTLFAKENDRNSIPGLSALRDADLLLLSVRRRVLPEGDMAILREYVYSGKPVIGLRTSSHAFSLRDGSPPDGYADWPSFDADVFGGNYHGSYPDELRSTVQLAPSDTTPAIVRGLDEAEFVQGGHMYKVSPLANGAQVLLTGQVDGHPAEPVAWTFKRADDGKSVYIALGHPEDFQQPLFQHL